MNAIAWAVLAALIWGFVPLLEKWGLKGAAPLPGLFYRCLGVLLGLLVLGLFMLRPQEIKSVDGKSAFFLILSGLLASFLAQICFYNALKLGEVSRVVPISGSYPFLTFLLGVLVLGESFNIVKLCAVALIVSGIWLLKI